MKNISIKKIIELLELKPLPFEGGYYRETYRSDEIIEAGQLSERYGADKHTSTAIYYLLTPDTVSKIHRLKSDEVFHFYLGDPVTLLLLYSDGVTDTQNVEGVSFGQERLKSRAGASLGCSAQETLDTLLAGVQEFAGKAEQSDDVTLMVVTRDRRVTVIANEPGSDTAV